MTTCCKCKQPTNACECAKTLPCDVFDELPPPLPTRALHDASKGDKLPLQHLPFEALEECAAVMRWGTVKYPYENWRKGAPWLEFTGSILRHVWAFMSGVDKDPESGLHPLAHAALDCLFIITWAKQGKGEDDRVK